MTSITDIVVALCELNLKMADVLGDLAKHHHETVRLGAMLNAWSRMYETIKAVKAEREQQQVPLAASNESMDRAYRAGIIQGQPRKED